MTPLYNLLLKGVLPEDEGETTRINGIPVNYLISDGELYRWGFSTLFLQCISSPKTEWVPREYHKATCHERAHSLVQTIFRLDYYWSTMSKDASELTKSCKTFQKFALKTDQPPFILSPITGAWPLTQWEINILELFSMSIGQRTHIIVTIDYFSKWIKAKALASSTEFQVLKFLKDNIISCYGVP